MYLIIHVRSCKASSWWFSPCVATYERRGGYVAPCVREGEGRAFTPALSLPAQSCCEHPAPWLRSIKPPMSVVFPAAVCSRHHEQMRKVCPVYGVRTVFSFQGFLYSNLLSLVIDEADRILQIGFEDEMNAILQLLPQTRQTCLFSATQSAKVADLARLSLKKPVFVQVCPLQAHCMGASVFICWSPETWLLVIHLLTKELCVWRGVVLSLYSRADNPRKQV